MMQCCSRCLGKLRISISCHICCIVLAINVYINHTIIQNVNRSSIMVGEGISAAGNICKCRNVINIDYSVAANVYADELVVDDNRGVLAGIVGVLDMEQTLYLCAIYLCIGSVTLSKSDVAETSSPRRALFLRVCMLYLPPYYVNFGAGWGVPLPAPSSQGKPYSVFVGVASS